MVQRVAAIAGDHVADQRPAEQEEVAHQIEDLVANELVGNRRWSFSTARLPTTMVLSSEPPRARPALPHRAHVLEEAVGAGRRELLHEGGLGDLERQHLQPDRRMVVVERIADRRPSEKHTRSQRAPSSTRMGASMRSGARRAGKHHAARALQQLDELPGAAVEPGQLIARDVHQEIVDAKPGGGRHQVLDGADPHAERPHRGGEMTIHHMLGIGRDQRSVRGPEQDPGVAAGRGNGEPDGLAAMETDTLDARRLPDRPVDR